MYESVLYQAARATMAGLAVGLLAGIFLTGYMIGYLQASDDIVQPQTQNNWKDIWPPIFQDFGNS